MADEVTKFDMGQVHPDKAVELARKTALESTAVINQTTMELQQMVQRIEQGKALIQAHAAKRREALEILIEKVPGFVDPDIPQEPQAQPDGPPADLPKRDFRGLFKLTK